VSPSVPIDVLVVAAHPPELGGLRLSLGEGMQGKIGDVHVVAEAVGIGLTAAAAGTAAVLSTYAPRALVLVGTCGVYTSRAADLRVGEVVTARRLHLASASAVLGRGAFPAPMVVEIDPDAELSRAVACDTRRVDIATTLAITTDDLLATEMSEALGCEVEHLEAFAVATACARARVPLAVMLGIANRVGSHARDEWRHHHQAAGLAAIDGVLAWLRRGAPGVRT
jgi:nucleoside phosphorylase